MTVPDLPSDILNILRSVVLIELAAGVKLFYRAHKLGIDFSLIGHFPQCLLCLCRVGAAYFFARLHLSPDQDLLQPAIRPAAPYAILFAMDSGSGIEPGSPQAGLNVADQIFCSIVLVLRTVRRIASGDSR